LTGLVIFFAIGVLTQLLTYQQYLIHKNTRLETISREANAVADRLQTSLSNSLSATRTLAFLVEKYGVPNDFDSIAKEILEVNKFIDALELTRRGVITHIYPSKGNVGVIGYDVLADSTRNQEAYKALKRKQLYFAGPLQLRQGGTAVVGRLPIFRNNEFWGFSVVLIRFTTLLAAAGIDKPSDKFVYQLSKRNPLTGNEDFFLPEVAPVDNYNISIVVPDGEWRLYVVPKEPVGFAPQVLSFAFLGLLFSITSGIFSWHLARQPEKLRRKVEEITSALNVYQKAATASLKRANRLYHFTSRINHVVVHATDEIALYQQVCEVGIDIGKFELAWVGIINEDEEKLFVVSSAGHDKGYLADVTPISISTDAREGPMMKMIRTGVFVHCNDIATDVLMKPWANKALERGYRSSILLPIRKFGKVVGSFNLYAHEANYFDDKEIQLLLETTNNISHTLEHLEKERMRRMAEQQIQAEKVFSDSMINSLPGIFYFYDRAGRFIKWNRNFEIVSGYSASEITNMHPLDFFHVDEKELLKEKIGEVFASGYDDVIADFYTKDKRRVPYFFNGRKMNFNDTDYLIGMGLDITDRVKTERELLERTEEIEKLSGHLQNIREEEQSRIALEIHDVLGQQLTALKMDATWIKKRAMEDQLSAERVAGMIQLIDETIKTVRRISSELRPGILDDLGLVAALEWQSSEFEKNTGISLKFETNKNDVQLERSVSTNIFRVYQETLTNIARHANATSVHTKFVYRDDGIQLVVKDNGIGIDFTEIKKKKSMGLISMKARARLFNGEVLLENVAPHGTLVTLKVPLIKNKNFITS
jgi:PAS domain S-box-containing protein